MRTREVAEVCGVKVDDVIFYYDTKADFVEAWPGIKMWLEAVKAQQLQLEQQKSKELQARKD